MKSVLLVSGFILSTSFGAQAATPKPSSSTLTSAADVLNLPAENRRMVVVGKADKYYSSFIDIAFNDQQPMALRWRALMAAAEAAQGKAIPDLKKAGDHKLWYMRNAALVALNEVSPLEAQTLARKLLKDKALVVRSAAVSVLDKNMSAEQRDLLWAELNQSYNFKGKESLWIRHQIVEVLAQRPRDNELKVFANLLGDKDARVHVPAVQGLQVLTGVKLGEGKMKKTALVSLWQNYIKKENL